MQAEDHDITLKENELRDLTTADVLLLETAVLSTITHEETRDLANAEEKAEEDRTNSLTRQIGDSFHDIVVSYSESINDQCIRRFSMPEHQLTKRIRKKSFPIIFMFLLSQRLSTLFQENISGSGAISSAEAEEYLREHMRIEGDLEKQRQEKKQLQIAAVNEKLEQRKKERLRKLKEKQELERAQVSLSIL